MKNTLFLFVLISMCSLTIFAQTNSPEKPVSSNKTAAELPVREKFDPTRNAAQDLADTISQTQKSGKRIVLDVGGEWCIWCRRMDIFILQNADLKKLVEENYVWLKINMSPENENKPFLAAYPSAPGYPHLYVLEKDGTLLKSKDTSELEEGKSYNLQKFTDFLQNYSPAKTTPVK